jgi:hypothetical protein
VLHLAERRRCRPAFEAHGIGLVAFGEDGVVHERTTLP